MKKYEKVLLAAFGGCIVFTIAAVLYKWLELGIVPDYYDNFSVTMTLFMLSVFGIITILVSWRLRKRAEAGKPPVSKLYKLSFLLSFVPFIVLLVLGVIGGMNDIGVNGFGWDVLWGTILLYGVILCCLIIPVFPAMIFWQILYIIKRIQYRKQMKCN